MADALLCSDCFKDTGLRLEARRAGTAGGTPCPACRSVGGATLDEEQLRQLAHSFFVKGSLTKFSYGAAPLIQFNEHQYGNEGIDASPDLKRDMRLIENAIKIGFFYYGPRLWMVGEVEPLKELENSRHRKNVIDQVFSEYPGHLLRTSDDLFRLRIAPNEASDPLEYDSAPSEFLGTGRLDSESLPVLYGSPDIEICLHECRVTVEDELFIANLRSNSSLRLLDLTEILHEDTTEFESLDIAIHMLFFAGKHSYEISRDIAIAARKKGFDGLMFPSYFSNVRSGAMPFETVYGMSIRQFPNHKGYAKAPTVPNIGLFGRPIAEGKVRVKCINRLSLRRIAYDAHFGPVDLGILSED